MGAPLTKRHEILSRNTRNFKLSYGENLKSLISISPGLELVPGRDGQTDRRTDRITVAYTKYSYVSCHTEK